MTFLKIENYTTVQLKMLIFLKKFLFLKPTHLQALPFAGLQHLQLCQLDSSI